MNLSKLTDQILMVKEISKTSSMTIVKINLFKEGGIGHGFISLNQDLAQKYINSHKRLPTYWSFKNEQLVYKIGTAAFSPIYLLKDLNSILKNEKVK